MSRRTRNWLDRSCYHLTHRCIERRFLFENAITRNTYQKELREMISRFNIDVLNYVITSNHIHILVYASKGVEIAKGMQYLQGRMAQRYNMLHKREGAFWSGRYHATLIESGNHLSECLFYIDYNMMRAKVVSHPSEWKHGGYHDISGNRKRYRIVNKKQLLRQLGMVGEEENFLEWYMNTINAKSESYMERQKHWTEALAVGDESWIEKIKGKIGKKRLRIIKLESGKAKTLYSQTPLSEPPSFNEERAPYVLY